jgi:hypothetical protein
VQVAQADFPKGNLYMKLRESVGTIISEQGRLPKGKEARDDYAKTVGEDGYYLFDRRSRVS